MMQPENRHEINNLSRPPEIKAARENQQQQEHQISHCMMHNTKASRQRPKPTPGKFRCALLMKHVPDEISTMRCPMNRISSLINSTAPGCW